MKYLYIIAVILSVVACTEDMDVNLDRGETRLSVEASVTTDLKKHVVKLKESSDVFYVKAAVVVTNAIISVTDGSNTYTYTEKSPGYYESNIEFAGKVGKMYSLSIKGVDINKDGVSEEYTASSSMRKPYVVNSVKLHFDPEHESSDSDEGEGKFWLLSLSMEDDADTHDYYGFACQINDVMVHDTITEVHVIKDTYFNGKQVKDADVAELNQSKSDEILSNLDKVTLETYAISKGYYNFVDQLQEMEKERSMFSGPPGNIATNISNGAIGFFAVYSITRTSVIHKAE